MHRIRTAAIAYHCVYYTNIFSYLVLFFGKNSCLLRRKCMILNYNKLSSADQENIMIAMNASQMSRGCYSIRRFLWRESNLPTLFH